MSKSKPNDLGDQLTHDLKQIFENAAEREDVIKMKKQAKELADVASDFIREYPLQTVLGAAVVGFAIGHIFGRRK